MGLRFRDLGFRTKFQQELAGPLGSYADYAGLRV